MIIFVLLDGGQEEIPRTWTIFEEELRQEDRESWRNY